MDLRKAADSFIATTSWYAAWEVLWSIPDADLRRFAEEVARRAPRTALHRRVAFAAATGDRVDGFLSLGAVGGLVGGAGQALGDGFPPVALSGLIVSLAGVATRLDPAAAWQAAEVGWIAWQRSGRSELQAAVTLAEVAVAGAVGTHGERPAALGTLAICLELRYGVVGDWADLARSIALDEEAVRLTPTGPNRAGRLSNLANRLQSRYEAVGDPADLDRSIDLGEEAVRLTPTGPHRARHLSNLVNRLQSRYRAVGDPADLDRSIDLGEEAVKLTSTGADRAGPLNNLGNLLHMRYEAVGDRANLDRAIRLGEEAVRLTPSGPDRAGRLNNLGGRSGNLHRPALRGPAGRSVLSGDGGVDLGVLRLAGQPGLGSGLGRCRADQQDR